MASKPPQDSAPEWNNRGGKFFDSSRYLQAESCFRKALELASASPVPQTGELATIRVNLATTLRLQARYAEAEPLYLSALNMATNLSPEHSNTQRALSGLALLYSVQGRLAEAEVFARRNLQLAQTEQVESSVLSETANDLAIVLLTEGQYRESESLAKLALTVAMKNIGHSQAASADALNTLGRISLQEGRNRSAECYFSQAAVILQSLGSTSPTLVAVWNNLGAAQARCGDHEAAIRQLKGSILALQQLYGANHPEVASGLTNLATVYKDLKQYKKSRALYEQSLEIDSRVLGPQSAKAVADLNNLGSLAFLQHHYRESEALLGRALAINERSLGENHKDTGLLAGNLARLYCQEKRFAEAEPLLKKAVAVRELNFGPDDPILGMLLAEYTVVLRHEMHFSEAEQAEVRSMKIRVRNELRSEPSQK